MTYARALPRLALVALVPLAPLAPACSGDPDTTTGATQGSTGSMGSTGSTADASASSTTADATTTDATTTAATTTTGDDSSTTAPDLPPGQCWSEFHGVYWCECTDGNTRECRRGGVSTCFVQNATVITHTRWGPCGECVPGEQEACDVDGAPGRRFCDVNDVQVADIQELPTPAWGVCVLEGEIVCEPGDSKLCDDGIYYQACEVDAEGVPAWTECP